LRVETSRRGAGEAIWLRTCSGCAPAGSGCSKRRWIAATTRRDASCPRIYTRLRLTDAGAGPS